MRVILLLTFLSVTIPGLAQSIEPSPASFNWGTHTGIMTASDRLQKKVVLGWEWTSQDSSFNRYMLANTFHDKRAPHTKSVAARGMNFVLELSDTLTSFCMRYDAEVLPDLSAKFRPATFDSSGAAFGWGTRDTTIVSIDTATSLRSNGRAILQGTISTPSRIVLSNVQPKKTSLSTPVLCKVHDFGANPINGKVWMLTANISRIDSTSVDVSSDTAISFRLKFWYTIIDNSGVKEYRSRNIKFDSIANNTTWHDRGYWETACRQYTGEDTTIFSVKRSMMPLVSSSGHPASASFSGYFTLGTVFNPDLTWDLDGLNSKNSTHIDSIDVLVYYHGFPIALDYVRIEQPRSRQLLRGDLDSAVIKQIQGEIDTLRLFSADSMQLYRVSPFVENRLAQRWAVRHISKLCNGFVSSPGGTSLDYPIHSEHIMAQHDQWLFGHIGGVNPYLAAPYFPRVLDSSMFPICRQVTPKDPPLTGFDTTYPCSNHAPSLGYKMGYRAYTDRSMGDTLKSMYEIYALNAAYAPLTSSQYSGLDTLNSSLFQVYSGNSDSYQIRYDGAILRTFDLAGDDDMLYRERPWWVQKQLHVYYDLVTVPYDNSRHYIINQGLNRPPTGEEVRHILWSDVIRGCKGIMMDASTFPVGIHGYDTNYCEIGIRKSWMGNHFDSTTTTESDYIQVHDTSRIHVFVDKKRVADILDYGDSNRIYLGSASERKEVKQVFAFMTRNSDEIMRMRLVSWFSKGFKTHKSGDTNTLARVIRMNRDSIHVRPIGRGGLLPYYEPRDSTFYDITLLRDSSDKLKNLNSVFYVGVVNRRTDPLRYVCDPISNPLATKRLKFLSTAEYVDSCKVSHDSTLWRAQKWTQLGSREITVPFAYSPPSTDRQGRLLHVQEMTADSTAPHIDTVICATCPLAAQYLPGEGKMFKVTVVKPKDATVATGQLDFANQRKVIAMPVLVGSDLVNNRGIYDSSRVRYHIVFSREDTLGFDVHTSSWITKQRVYYKRSKIVANTLPQDVNPLDANLTNLWDTTMCISNDIHDPDQTCLSDSLLANPDCKYPALVVRYNPSDHKEYVYVVYTCFEPYPTHPRPLSVIESQFSSTDTIPVPLNMVIDRPDYGTLDTYGHATINASSVHNYYAWSTYKNGINIACRTPTPDYYSRCRHSTVNWRRGEVSWWGSKADSSTGAECAHPSLNTYSRLSGEDECALVWEESFTTTGLPSIDHNWHIYYTQLHVDTLGILRSSLPQFKSACTGILDTNTQGRAVVRMSRFSKVNDSYQVHRMASVVRDLHEVNLTTKWDNAVWAASDGTYSGPLPLLCSGTTTGIISEAVFEINDSLKAEPNNNIHSCPFNMRNPSASWTSSFSHDSDIVFDFECSSSAMTDYTMMHMAKSYWHLTSPTQWIIGGYHPHLSASPLAVNNVQWKQLRRLATLSAGSNNSKIYSSVRALYKQGSGMDIISYKLVGFTENQSRFLICDDPVEDEYGGMSSLFYGTRERIASDTIFSDYFVVNDRKHLRFVMQGSYENIASMYLENQRTGESTPVDMSRVIIDSSRSLPIGTYDVTNGGSDNFRVLVVKTSAPALYVEEQYIDVDDHPYAKTSVAQDQSYEVDLSAISGKGANSISVYPNPASDELFIALPHESRQEELSGNLLQVVVSTAIGEEVARFESHGGETVRFPTTSLATGMYNVFILNAHSNNQSPSIRATTFVLRR